MKVRRCSVAAEPTPIVGLMVVGLAVVVLLSAVVGVRRPGAQDGGPWRAFELGTSAAGRPLPAYQRLGRQPGRHIVVVGVIHGDERAGLAVTDALLDHGDAALPDDVTVTVVPDLNPDGSALGQRGNAHGVDLNRNFPFDWQAADESPFTMGGYYPGPSPLSEPESAALYRWLSAARPDLVLWYHQPWGLVVCDERSGWECPAFAAAVSMPVDAAPRPGSAAQWSSDNGMATAVVELPERGITEQEVAAHLAAIGRVLYAAAPTAARPAVAPSGTVLDAAQVGTTPIDAETLAEQAAVATLAPGADAAVSAAFTNTGPRPLSARLEVALGAGEIPWATPPGCIERQEVAVEPGATVTLGCTPATGSLRPGMIVSWSAALIDPADGTVVAAVPSRTLALLPVWKLPPLGRAFGCAAAAVSRLRCSAQR